ncbi:28S ribosomal protein S29 [Mactra antiquata]
MKRSIISYRSYCQLLRLWSSKSARVGSSSVCCVKDNIVTSLPACFQLTVPPGRSYCTSTENVDEEEDVIEDDIDDVGPTIPVFQHRTNLPAKFRTQHDDPTKFSLEDVGLYYKVSPEDYKKYIQSGQWPGYKKQVKTFTEATVMVRQPALEVLDIIENANYDYPPLRLFFYGKVGTGKSMSLSHVVQHCGHQGMLTIHIPDFNELIRHRTSGVRPHAPSEYTDGLIDYTDDALNWLQYFKLQNEELLKKLNIKTTKEYVWSARDSTPVGSDILDLLSFGLERKKYSSDCIGAMFREIKKAANEKRVKVLVAIDGVNGLWKNTTIKDSEKKIINAQKVSTIQHFHKLFEHNWSNGICVGTLCPSVEAINNTMYENKMDVPYTPQYLLKKEGFDYMDPFVPIIVSEYNFKEAHNCIDYYIERKWIQSPRSLTESGKKEIMMLANMNPLQLMTISGRF